MNEEKPRQQLKMIWPTQLLDPPPMPHLATGYTLRTYQPGDEPGFYKVMDQAGFRNWDDDTLRPWLLKILPDGWFLVLHQASGEIVATAMANHNPQPLFPFGGELGWVAAHRDHAGKGLGMTVCAAVVRRLLQAGYRNMHLSTDDWRLPAISIYLRLGWLPFLYAPDMEERWRAVCPQVNWAFTPQDWPKTPDVHLSSLSS